MALEEYRANELRLEGHDFSQLPSLGLSA